MMLQDIPNRRLLKPGEVAAFLGVSAKTVYRWCEMGLMESIKLNRSVRVLRASVLSFCLTTGAPASRRPSPSGRDFVVYSGYRRAGSLMRGTGTADIPLFYGRFYSVLRGPEDFQNRQP